MAVTQNKKLDNVRALDVIRWRNKIIKLKKDKGELFSTTYPQTAYDQFGAILNHIVKNVWFKIRWHKKPKLYIGNEKIEF